VFEPEGKSPGQKCCNGVLSIGRFVQMTPRPASIVVQTVETNEVAVMSSPYADEYSVVSRDMDAAHTTSPSPKMQVSASFCRRGNFSLKMTGGTIKTMTKSVTMLYTALLYQNAPRLTQLPLLQRSHARATGLHWQIVAVVKHRQAAETNATKPQQHLRNQPYCAKILRYKNNMESLVKFMVSL
jgi:hypothetical protein